MVLLDVVYNHFGPEGNYLSLVRAAVLQRPRTRRRGARRSTSTASGSAHGARLLHPQRALLARGVPLRRPAPRRVHAIVDDSPHAHPERARRRGAPRARAASATSTSCSRTTRNQRAPARDAAAAPHGDRAVERRLRTTPCTCSLTGETRRLLPRLRRPPGVAPRRARSPRASPTRASPRAHRDGERARRARVAPAARGVRATSCRTTTRSATARSASGSATLAPRRRAARSRVGRAAARARGADALHGRGVRRRHAVPLLLRFRAASSRARCATAAAREFARLRALRRRRRCATRSPTPTPRATFLALEARLGRASSAPRARRVARALPRAARAARARRSCRGSAHARARGALRGRSAHGGVAVRLDARRRRAPAPARATSRRTRRARCTPPPGARVLHAEGGATPRGDASPPWSGAWTHGRGA